MTWWSKTVEASFYSQAEVAQHVYLGKYLQEFGIAEGVAWLSRAHALPPPARTEMLFRVDGRGLPCYLLPSSPRTLLSYIPSQLYCFESLLLSEFWLKCGIKPVHKLTHCKVPVAINSKEFFLTSPAQRKLPYVSYYMKPYFYSVFHKTISCAQNTPSAQKWNNGYCQGNKTHPALKQPAKLGSRFRQGR